MAVLLYNSEDGLKGAERDIDMYVRFLLSSRGGSWRTSEIAAYDVSQLSLSALLAFVIYNSPDYLMLVYAGHGYMQRGRTYFEMANGQCCAVEYLSCLVDKQLTIVDCCRVLRDGVLLEGTMQKSAAYAPDVDTSSIFCKAIYEADNQCVTMYACSPAQTADDNYSYSYAMLNSIRNEPPGNNSKILNVRRVYLSAVANLAHSRASQTPILKMNPQWVLNPLPFAIV